MSPEIEVTTAKLLRHHVFKWFELGQFKSEDEFRAAAKAEMMRMGDRNPTLLFVMGCDIPRRLSPDRISEDLHPDLWDGWVLLPKDDQDLLANYTNHCNPVGSPTLAEAKARLIGRYDSREGYGREVWQERGWLDSLPDSLHGYIDFDAWVRDRENSGEFITRLSLHDDDDDIWVWKPNL